MTTRAADRHVHEADVVRVLTFACVIAVHTVANTNPATSVSANGFVMLLHFTREAFFCLTGFVLVHQYLGRQVVLSTFYRRRLLTVGAPYVAWSVVYTFIERDGVVGWSFISKLGNNLAAGNAWYHLYFLLVSMQIYLLYPLLAKLIRATAAHHGRLLAISGSLQIALLSWLHYWPPTSGPLGWFSQHESVLIVTYQFYVLVGAVAAFHLEQVRRWEAAHRPLVVGFTIASAAAAVTWYALVVRGGTKASTAAAVLQPVMVVWSLGAVAGLFSLGAIWARRRVADGLTDRALRLGSDRSFGVFLAHPLVLWAVLEVGWIRGLPNLPLTIVAYLLTVLGSLVLVEGLRRSPVSLMSTGRPKLSGAPQEIQPRKESRHEPQFIGTA
ncbi:MAG: Surface polysaccharide O-acyltransferase-like enzyme [Pseudonocardiales bacterium]|nr:Surface polysaccharide O-acyltransferase-like enzyme [Pseudonocardiales bacterium]